MRRDSEVTTQQQASDTAEQGQLATETRVRLAAERLFADRGIDAVSLRSIMAEAGTNIASIHYHYGSKEALVKAVIIARSDQVSKHRLSMLMELADHRAPTAGHLAHILVTPVVDMVDDDGAAWVRLIGNLITSGGPYLSFVTDTFVPQGEQLIMLLRKIHPDWSLEKSLFRLGQAMRTTFVVLGNTEDDDGPLRDVDGRQFEPGKFEEEVEELVSMMLQ